MPFGKTYSYLLVFLQFVFIFLLALYANAQNLGFIQYGFIFLGLWLGVWALYVMRKSKLRIAPDVAKDAVLIKKGPYKYLRHPMYSAVLIFCFGIALTNFYATTLEFLIALLVILLLKVNYEEIQLNKTFDQYKAYSKRTKKLIPFIY